MTVPTQHNCPHLGDGWCLDCVQAQAAELGRLQRVADELATAHKQIAELEGDCEHQQFRLTRFQASQISRAALARHREGGTQ